MIEFEDSGLESCEIDGNWVERVALPFCSMWEEEIYIFTFSNRYYLRHSPL